MCYSQSMNRQQGSIALWVIGLVLAMAVGTAVFVVPSPANGPATEQPVVEPPDSDDITAPISIPYLPPTLPPTPTPTPIAGIYSPKEIYDNIDFFDGKVVTVEGIVNVDGVCTAFAPPPDSGLYDCYGSFVFRWRTQAGLYSVSIIGPYKGESIGCKGHSAKPPMTCYPFEENNKYRVTGTVIKRDFSFGGYGVDLQLHDFTEITTEPTTLSPNQSECFVGGCSGQVCSDDAGIVSTCEWRDEYACYRTAKCERQSNGQCGWTSTPELTACLKNP